MEDKVVYRWFVKSTNYTFYVGSGSRGRAKNKYRVSRNKQFMEFIDNYDCDYEIIQDNLTRKDALDLEEILVIRYKSIGQCSACEKYGAMNSDITKKKISDGIINSDKHITRSIIQLNLDGSFVKKWDYINLAVKTLNPTNKYICRSNIVHCCKGDHKTCCGYKWMYEEDYIELIKLDQETYHTNQ